MLLTDAQVRAAFGDPAHYMLPDGSVDGAWQTAILGTVYLPAPLPLSWDRSHTVSRLQVHRRLVPVFTAVFKEMHENAAAWASIGDIGGAYAWRPQRGYKQLSRHCWAICVDLDVADNPLGGIPKRSMHPDVISTFQRHGFEWGGLWRRPDPMHFEFVDLARLEAA